ncbi:hypothetical protein OKW38_005662 [Paraburkholderia sp. MM5496-R1]
MAGRILSDGRRAGELVATTDLDLQVHTVMTSAKSSITRTDTLSSGTLTGNLAVETDYTSFADFLNTTANSDGYSVSYTNSPATNPLSTTPIGQLHSNFACTTNAFALTGGASRTLTWTLKYADPA